MPWFGLPGLSSLADCWAIVPLEVVGGEVQVPHVGIPQLDEVPVCGDCALAADLKTRQSTCLTCANAAVDGMHRTPRWRPVGDVGPSGRIEGDDRCRYG